MNALDKNIVVAVVGAGAMGSGIAQIAAQAGHKVFLQDQRAGAAEQGKAGVAAQLQKRVDKGKMAASELQDLLDRIHPVDSLGEVASAGLVIEAIIEDLSIKQQLFAQLEELCEDDTILATNTSSISVTALAAKMRLPERLVGMHFFNPAPLMALVEVVSGLATSKAVADTIYATSISWGKKPVHTTSTPGFIVNRVARPFYAEALRLLQEGAADAATIDAIVREAGGFRMGPFELMDLIGHDVNYAVTNSVFDAYYGDPRFQPSLIQKGLVDAGHLGRKSGRGFYNYAEGAEKPLPATATASDEGETVLVVEGDIGPASALIERFQASGIQVDQREGAGLLRFGEASLALTDGRMATERAKDSGIRDLLLFDLALNYASASRLALSASLSASDKARDDAVRLFQSAGISISLIEDAPGMVVMRTVAMLANEASDAVLQSVCSVADVNLAMCAGVNYPEGPLSWATRLGKGRVYQVLQHIQASYAEDRYRPSLLLRRDYYSPHSLIG